MPEYDPLPPATTDRRPPQDLDAERALLGAMMCDWSIIPAVNDVIRAAEAEAFYLPVHRELFRLVCRMHAAQVPIDLVTVRYELEKRAAAGEPIDLGMDPVTYLVDLVESIPSTASAEFYARIVREHWIMRELIVAAGRIERMGYGANGDVSQVLDEADRAMRDVLAKRPAAGGDAIQAAMIAAFQVIERSPGDKPTGVPTGIYELDSLLDGLQPGTVNIVAGRPSMGKSAFAQHLVLSAARAGVPVLLHSLEMSTRNVAERLLCASARVPAWKLRRSYLSEIDRENLRLAGERLKAGAIWIDDTPGITPGEFRARVRKKVAADGVRLVILDYIQLMRPDQRRYKDGRQVEVSEMSAAIQRLARELDIPIVVVAQLNRGVEDRSGCRPRMSDLRESGSLEQDADVVMLLHREDYYRKDETPEDMRGVAEVIIDKQRNGPTGTVQVHWDAECMAFGNLSERQRDTAYAHQEQDREAKRVPEQQQMMYEGTEYGEAPF